MKMRKVYEKVGEIFLKTITVLALDGAFISMFALWLLGY